ncbi:hypothetical protein HYQ44_014221 [Verticillium longisporum]|nr:hypothetical protein HYQ44_014221 [Verticillium longisporum]
MKPTTAPLRKKVVHSVDTSFSSVEWPSISEQDQDAILELIISLLAPLETRREIGKRVWVNTPHGFYCGPREQTSLAFKRLADRTQTSSVKNQDRMKQL